jgi:ubiquinone/menaquinone biosynthesis C-methylase UbiE
MGWNEMPQRVILSSESIGSPSKPAKPVDAWSSPDSLGKADVVQMAAHLESAARSPDQALVNAVVQEVMAPAPGEELLEVGSGSGVLCRRMAPAVAPGGRLYGLDVSPGFVRQAGKYAAAEGLSEHIAFGVGAGEALPFPAASFDGAFAARLLLHVPDPGAVVSEMRRVVRPGGRVVLMDWDFETVSVDHPDREVTRRLIRWRVDNHGGNNWSGRQLWRRAVDAGLGDPQVIPVTVVARNEADALTQSLWRAAQVARQRGGLTPAEHDAWVGELKARLAEGRFFASIVYFIVKGMV